MRFEGKTAVITGAGGGVGAEIAASLCREGASVVAVDLKERPEDLPQACDYIQSDITEEGIAEEVVARAAGDDGLDHLVNAAGVGWFGRDRSCIDTPDEIWNRVLEINLTAPMRFARAAVPAIRRAGGGSMVHIASAAGLRGMDEPMDAYQVSKAGVISLSRGLAVHLAPEGIRSNTICPGAIETPMVAEIYAEDPDRRVRMADRTPLRRLGQPRDIASACLHLLSDEASFVTGIDYVADGGWLSVLR
jgi:NAD(P)-dependent dehydrogenase (short-subunit alcohol dehydrogenase family)